MQGLEEFKIKSGIMLGLGEKQDEIRTAIKDLASIGLNVLTLGQYLQPSAEYTPIDRWVTPEEFENWKIEALKLGIEVVNRTIGEILLPCGRTIRSIL